MKKYLCTLAILAMFVGGCASSGSSVTSDIKVETDTDPKANLSGYKSYAWLAEAAIVYDDEGQWEPPQFDADAEIKFLIDRELRGHGMTEDSVNPDLLVAYAAGIDMDSLGVKTDPDSGLESIVKVPKGALAVILIDTDTGLTIWAGVAEGNISESPTTDTVKKRLDFAVSQMFSEFAH